jgi:Ca-activated chloride channel homolog
MHPSGPYDLFAGQDLVVLARYTGSGTVLVRFEGESANGRVSWTTEAELPENDRENTFVARLWATQRVGYLSAERRRSGASPEIDDEIRTLGEKYGIPTELTSYLVLEPGQVVARGRAAGRASDLSGAASPAPQAQAFEAAKAASNLRSVQTLAHAEVLRDTMMRDGVASRRVGTRMFTLRDSVWTDSRFSEGKRVVTVNPYSEAYFALVRELPDLASAFALGESVLVCGTKMAIAIAPNGVAQLTRAQIGEIVAAW